jgi:hypothetical protein
LAGYADRFLYHLYFLSAAVRAGDCRSACHHIMVSSRTFSWEMASLNLDARVSSNADSRNTCFGCHGLQYELV